MNTNPWKQQETLNKAVGLLLAVERGEMSARQVLVGGAIARETGPRAESDPGLQALRM
jgi:hypothetical protein